MYDVFPGQVFHPGRDCCVRSSDEAVRLDTGYSNLQSFCEFQSLTRLKCDAKMVDRSYLLQQESIGVNISERKCGTDRMQKRKKWEFVIFHTARGNDWYCSTSSRCYTDFARATIIRDIFVPGPTRQSQLKP